MNGPSVVVNPPAGMLGDRHVILRGRGGRRPYHVADFAGPLSIKSVVSGEGIWETDSGRFRVDDDSYLVLNDGRKYTISVDTPRPTETFCIFFERGFVEEVFRARTTTAFRLLDEPEPARREPLGFFEVLWPHGDGVSRELARLRARLDRGEATEIGLEDRLHELAVALLSVEARMQRETRRLPALRPATREVLFRRLHRGRDFIEGALAERLTLARVAREACLSPHHFHRLFRQAFGESPGRYITRRRLERARRLLESTDRPVTDVCFDVGFESLGSFSALFKRRFGRSPRELRPRAEKSKREEAPRAVRVENRSANGGRV